MLIRTPFSAVTLLASLSPPLGFAQPPGMPGSPAMEAGFRIEMRSEAERRRE